MTNLNGLAWFSFFLCYFSFYGYRGFRLKNMENDVHIIN